MAATGLDALLFGVCAFPALPLLAGPILVFMNSMKYLEGELATDRENISSLSPSKRSALERVKSTLDREIVSEIA
jgi:hypothetical protein